MDARRLTVELGGTWRGSYGTAPCPAHRDHCWALKLWDGENGVDVHCNVGCSRGRVIDALNDRGLSVGEASSPRHPPRATKPKRASRPTATGRRSVSTSDIELAFACALADAGLAPRNDETIPADGKLHRFRVTADRPGQRTGWAILYADGTPRGTAGDWRSGERLTWFPNGANRTAAERRESTAARRRLARERDATTARAARKAVDLWGRLPPAPADHPYLALKRVPPGPCRVTKSGALALAVRDASTGKVVSLQFILPDADGSKRFLFGGRTAGGCLALGDLDGDGPVVIAEGFATAASIREATGWPVVVAFSAGNLKAVAEAMRAKFPERKIIVAGDNDAKTPGNPGVTKATEAARTARARLAVPPKAGDFNDLARADGPAAVAAILEAAAEPEPELKAEADKQAIARLAKLPPFDYDRAREDEANRLGVRVGTLDRLVARERGDLAGDETSGSAVLFPEPEPWPDEVDGAALLNDLADTFTRYVIMPAGAADAAALWALHAHAHDAAGISPILAITSPTPECGKTTLMTLLGAVVPKPLTAANFTPASVFRSVEKWRPTLLVDEAGSFLRENDELRAILNSGHSRAYAFVIRTVGDDHEPRRFTTWAPKALALIGKLPPTLASRSIHIEQCRLAPDERVEPMRADRLDHLQPLARQAARWAADRAAALRDAEPDMPAMLTGRRADNWRPLFAIADSAGGEWPARSRRAAETLSAGRSDETRAVMLIEDIHDIFAERGVDRIASSDLAAALAEREDRPWPEWRRGKPITPRQIARLLEPFGIKPAARRDGGTVFKGYTKAQFVDVFTRYLGDDQLHGYKPQKSWGKQPSRSVTPPSDVTDQTPPKPAENLDCNRVTDDPPLLWTDEM